MGSNPTSDKTVLVVFLIEFVQSRKFNCVDAWKDSYYNWETLLYVLFLNGKKVTKHIDLVV